MLAILAVVLGLGLAVYLASPASGRELARWQLREWLLLAVAGLVVAAFGWVMFIPADPYYTPSVFGMTNRVNAVAGFGLVIAVYATLGVGTALVARVVPMVRRWAPLVTVVLGLMLGAAYVHVLERHIGIWDAAFRAETATITKMKSKFPRLPHGTTVFTSNFPAYQTLGVPIFASTWDLNGMVKMEYSDWTLSAYPMIQGLKLTCQADGVDLHGAGALPEVPYGRARLLDLQTGRHSDPHTRRECLAVAGSYSPGPLYLSTAY
jgi:hypothetical protein